MTSDHCNVAVVVPLFNKENIVSSCIESVARQTVLPSLLVVVDDGSTDSSFKVAEEALRAYPGPHLLIEQHNAGVSVARNKGVEVARTEYVCLLDADDVWDVDFVERMVGLIADFPKADLYCLGHRVFSPDVGLFVPRHGFPSGFRGYLSDFFASSAIGSVANSSKVAIRATALLAVGGFPRGAKVGEDLYVWMMLALQGRVACESYIAVTVNQLEDNSRRSRRGNIPYPIEFFGRIENRCSLTPSAKKYLYRMYLLHLAEYVRLRDYRGVYSLMRQAFFLSPFGVIVSALIMLLPSSVLSQVRLVRRRLRK